jgi:hypothetical protein
MTRTDLIVHRGWGRSSPATATIQKQVHINDIASPFLWPANAAPHIALTNKKITENFLFYVAELTQHSIFDLLRDKNRGTLTEEEGSTRFVDVVNLMSPQQMS